jgi:hypothetical protein
VAKLSKEDIERIQQELSTPYGMVDLECDGYKIAVRVQQVKRLSYAPVVYVNGVIKGEWFRGDCEEAKRFLCPKNRPYYSPKVKAEILKGWGKRAAKKAFPKLDEKMTFYVPSWSSVSAMLRHICRTNESVSIVSVGYPLSTEQPASTGSSLHNCDPERGASLHAVL